MFYQCEVEDYDLCIYFDKPSGNEVNAVLFTLFSSEIGVQSHTIELFHYKFIL